MLGTSYAPPPPTPQVVAASGIRTRSPPREPPQAPEDASPQHAAPLSRQHAQPLILFQSMPCDRRCFRGARTHSNQSCQRASCRSVAAEPTTIKPRRARVSITFRRRQSPRNPTRPPRLERTAEKSISSLLPPLPGEPVNRAPGSRPCGPARLRGRRCGTGGGEARGQPGSCPRSRSRGRAGSRAHAGTSALPLPGSRSSFPVR